MITLNEFIYLANRSSLAFMGTMMGRSLDQAAHNKRAWEEATAAYARMFPGNGRPDDIQLRALAHAAAMYKELWRGFRKVRCGLYRALDLKGGVSERCKSHRELIYCHKEFEDWMQKVSY